MRKRLLSLFLVLPLGFLATPEGPYLLAQEASAHSVMAEFPAQESHQGVTIAVVPILDTPDAEKIFGPVAAPARGGFLAVEFIVSNHREETIKMALKGIVIYSDEDRFELIDVKTVALGLYPRPKKEVEDPTKPKRRLPLPIPLPPWGNKQPKDKKKKVREEAEAALRSRQLRSAQVAPGGFARGYLYFDLRRASIDVEQAVVHIPNVRETGSGKNLLFFDISLKPYALP